MTARHPNVPNLTDFDLKLLRVFHAVVQCQGLAPARDALGVSLSTISIQLKQLEERLGFTLCERGRKGFALTDEGARIHESLKPLFDSIGGFRDVIADLRGSLGGDLHLGVVDALATNPDAPLPQGFKAFAEQAPQVHLVVDVSSPQELIQGLGDGRYDCILTPVEPDGESIDSSVVFAEQQRLYCGADHPLFTEDDPDAIVAALETATFTGKSYISSPPLKNPRTDAEGPVVSHMESNALLVLSGRYLGYLPNHFAGRWVNEGRMRALLPDRIGFTTEFHLAINKHHCSRTVRAFRDCMYQALSGSTGEVRSAIR